MSTVYFTYEGTQLNFSTGQIAPVFPKPTGLTLHTYTTESPYITVTNRYYGLSNMFMRSENVLKDDRDTVFDYYETTLDNGYNDFTVIDHRKRFLFETSWNNWLESWRKMRGGVHNIEYNLSSSIPWTPPSYAAYLMTSNDLTSYNLDTTATLTTTDGVFVDNAGDSNVLRLNGYALKVTGAAGVQNGASGNVVFKKSEQYNNISIFCQVRAPLSPSGAIVLCRLNSGESYCDLRLENGGIKNDLVFFVDNNGDTARYYDPGDHRIENDTWYDICVSYDAVNQHVYLYSFAAGDTTFSNYLDGETDINSHYTSNTSPTFLPIDRKIDSVELLFETVDGSITNTETVYLQNLMIFDGYVDNMMFNTLRRTCYLWNKKTGQYPK